MISPTNRNIIFGGIVAVTVSVVVYWWLFSSKKEPQKSQAKKIESLKKEKEVPELNKEITVEDVDEEEGSEELEEEDEDDSDVDVADEEDEEDEEEVEQLEVKQAPQTAQSTPSANKKSEDKATEAKQDKEGETTNAPSLKEQYDAAVRLSQKLITGGMNEKAVEKLTEAITLAQQVPSAGKDVLTLYNNRSAMYEKLGQFDKSLSDINVVLTIDANHVKARVRRARVYEAMGRVNLSLQDYVHATIIERARGLETNYDKKITELSKHIAIDKTDKTLQSIRSSNSSGKRAFPSKAYCRNFMEAYPLSYVWKKEYFGLSREKLLLSYRENQQKYQNRPSTLSIEEASALLHGFLESGADLVKFDMSHDNYVSAFQTLTDIGYASYAEEEKNSRIMRSLASFFREMRGTQFHLLSNIGEAMSEYQLAVEINPANLSAHLKYNAILLESGEREKALSNYDSLLAILQKEEEESAKKSSEDHKSDDEYADARSSPSPVVPVVSLENEKKEVKVAYIAWVLLHRASLWISRDERGLYSADAFNKAKADLDNSLIQSANVVQLSEGKGAQFIALLKQVQLRTHTKQAMEMVTTEEDYSANRVAIQTAKTLFPDHESVLLLEVEQLALEGDTEGAGRLVDKAAKSGNYDEFIILNLRATVSTQMAFMALQSQAANPQSFTYAQQLFGEVTQYYQRAMELDPESLETKAQFAQLKSMVLGDLQGSIELLKEALDMARSRDEVQDILTMLANNEAQWAAIQEIQKANQQS